MSEWISIGLIIFVFVWGFGLGAIFMKWQWKRNAKDYIGIDGYKVFPIQFYDASLCSKFMEYLEKSPKD